MSLIKNAMLGGAGYDVANSGAFASEQSDYLSRTFSTPTSQDVWTLSQFVKRTEIDITAMLFAPVFIAGQEDRLYFQADNSIKFYINGGDAGEEKVITEAKYRDVAEWYHVVTVMDSGAAGGSRMLVYINSILQDDTDTGTTFPTNTFNSAREHYLGKDGFSNNHYFDGCMAEVHFIDGQALTPDNFAEEDTNGHWSAKKYGGTYGTNGFYLNFQNGASLGEDSSGNGNDFTNTGVTQSTDTPTDNHAKLNPLHITSNFPSGAGTIHSGAGSATYLGCATTMFVDSGKWYWEVTLSGSGVLSTAVGVVGDDTSNTDLLGSSIASWADEAANNVAYNHTGTVRINTAAAVGYGDTWTYGDVIGVALDMDTKEITFYKNNVSQGVAASGLTGALSAASIVYNLNVLTYAFTEASWTYSAPAGFLALSSKNLPEPEIKVPTNYFKAIAYDNGAGAKTVGFQPDLVWMKSRGSTFSHKLVDAVRGVTKALSSDSVTAEVTEATGLTSFDANGFTVGADTDYSDSTGLGMIAWNWKESVLAGVDIVSYVGTGVAHAIAHSLATKPQLFVCFNRDTARQHLVYSEEIAATKWMALEVAGAAATSSTPWNNTEPTTSDFTVGTSVHCNENGDNFIAYLFAGVEGFSKFGSYSGNGSADGAFVNCGFRPAYVMIKRTDVGYSWVIKDTSRNDSNLTSATLLADTTNAEQDPSTEIDILSNGFKLRTTSVAANTSGGNYIYMAFAEKPFKYSRAR